MAVIPSLVVSVGDVVIDSAPTAVEQWAIATGLHTITVDAT